MRHTNDFVFPSPPSSPAVLSVDCYGEKVHSAALSLFWARTHELLLSLQKCEFPPPREFQCCPNCVVNRLTSHQNSTDQCNCCHVNYLKGIFDLFLFMTKLPSYESARQGPHVVSCGVMRHLLSLAESGMTGFIRRDTVAQHEGQRQRQVSKIAALQTRTHSYMHGNALSTPWCDGCSRTGNLSSFHISPVTQLMLCIRKRSTYHPQTSNHANTIKRLQPPQRRIRECAAGALCNLARKPWMTAEVCMEVGLVQTLLKSVGNGLAQGEEG